MKVKRMGITEILRRIWLFSANKIKNSESFSKQPTQLIIAANNCHTKSKGLCVFFYKTCIWDSNEIRSRFFLITIKKGGASVVVDYCFGFFWFV